jgi:gluconolactonase
MTWEFEAVAGPYEFTEGPVWDPERGVVFFTDIPTSTILRYDPDSGGCIEWATETNRGNGLALGPKGNIYCCEMGTDRAGHQVSRYDRDGQKTVLADAYDGKRLNSPNDLVFDSEGRLWFTDPDYDDQEDLELGHLSAYCLDPAGDPGTTDAADWELARVTHDTTNPNGLLFSRDERTMYIAESPYGEDNDRELRAYPVAGAARREADDGRSQNVVLGEYEVLHDFGPHRGIDGMCLTREGNIVATAGWEASGPGGLLYVFTPAGRVLETHPYPADRPTNCAFGGEDLSTLYVTGFDGHLYRVETDRVGYPVPP